jgi:hypothetical protein
MLHWHRLTISYGEEVKRERNGAPQPTSSERQQAACQTRTSEKVFSMQNPFGTSSQKLEVERGKRWLIGLAGYGRREFCKKKNSL